MSADTLSEVLRAVRLRGAIFYYIDGISPWVAEAPPAREIAAAILPGAEHMIEYHVVTRGRCFGTLVGGDSVELHEGDVIMFPQGDAHVMSSAPGMRVAKVDKQLFFSPKPAQLPYVLLQQGERTSLAPGGEDLRKAHGNMRGSSREAHSNPNPAHRAFTLDDAASPAIENLPATTARLDGGGTERATLVCGFLACDARPFNPLLAALPRMLHMPGAAAKGAWIAHFIGIAVEEANRKRPGGEAVLERLSEMMFVDVVRRYLEELPPNQT
ncbi:MAG TPA: cupin domain-containing protein, partial [Rhodanobacteraceae bacterium]